MPHHHLHHYHRHPLLSSLTDHLHLSEIHLDAEQVRPRNLSKVQYCHSPQFFLYFYPVIEILSFILNHLLFDLHET